MYVDRIDWNFPLVSCSNHFSALTLIRNEDDYLDVQATKALRNAFTNPQTESVSLRNATKLSKFGGENGRWDFGINPQISQESYSPKCTLNDQTVKDKLEAKVDSPLKFDGKLFRRPSLFL